MCGFRLKHLKPALLLLVLLVVLSVGYSDLPHGVFVLIFASLVFLAIVAAFARNSITQAHAVNARAAMTAPPRGGKIGAVAGRRKRAEALSPDAIVSLADERRKADVEDVFTSLDRSSSVWSRSRRRSRRSPRCCWSTGSGSGSACTRPGPACICALPGSGHRKDHGGPADGLPAAPAGLTW